MLGENIRALRKARGLSQQELAERLHVVRQTVSKWEQGLSVPDADMLVRLAECLEVSVEELLGAPKPESTVPLEPQAVLADKLSALTGQLAEQNHRRRPLLEMGRHRRRDMRAVAAAAASAYPAHAGVWPPGQ